MTPQREPKCPTCKKPLSLQFDTSDQEEYWHCWNCCDSYAFDGVTPTYCNTSIPKREMIGRGEKMTPEELSKEEVDKACVVIQKGLPLTWDEQVRLALTLRQCESRLALAERKADSIAVERQNTTKISDEEGKLPHPLSKSVAKLEERADDLRTLAGEAIAMIYCNAETGSMGVHSPAYLGHARNFQKRLEAIEKASAGK